MTKKDIILIEAPFSIGSNKRGTEISPQILATLGVQAKLATLSTIAHRECVDMRCWYNDVVVDGVRNKNDVTTACQLIMNVVRKNISPDSVILIIGGDHVISLGTIAASLDYDENVGIVYFDAHTDINTELTSTSANAHGMHIAALMGMCSSSLNEISRLKRLKSDNVFWVGTRSVDYLEWSNIKVAENIYSYNMICEKGMDFCLDEITKKIKEKHINTLHVSFDIDIMDPKIVPATGVPERNGIELNDLQYIMHWLRKQTGVCAIDFVEYNPLLDDKELSVGKWCVDTIYNLIYNTI